MKNEVIPIMADCRVGNAHQSRLCHSERTCPELSRKSEAISLHHSLFLVRHSIFTTTFAFLLMLSNIAVPAHAKYGGGTGEPNDPYLIFDANQMNAIGADSNDWDKHFLLMADIDLAAFTGTSFNIIGYYRGSNDSRPFKGVFDGNGHTISNFMYISARAIYTGLFGYVVGKDTEIKDLGLINPHVDAGTGYCVGSLVGYLREGTIANCYVNGGTVSGSGYFVGGLTGRSDGTITNCYSSSSVNGSTYAGGLAGYSNGTIINSYSVGRVLANGRRVGGLVGGNDGSILSSYSESNVSGNGRTGGLIGENNGLIINCYSIGSVSGGGGLVGADIYNYGVVRNSFWDIQSSGQTTSAGGLGKTTAEMQTASTFIGWGCGDVWTIDEGKDYPRLFWENKPGELITNPSYGGGSGDTNDPYLIYTAEQFNTIGLVACDWDKHFKLMADIDLSGFTGDEFNISGPWYIPFSGVFDGNGHAISNFSSNTGLFRYVRGSDAEIKNLGLIEPNVDAGTSDRVGSLVADLENGAISNCYVEGGSVAGDWYVGCLVGWNSGTITNCYSTGSVSGEKYVGGLVGHGYRGVTFSFWDIETSGQTTSAGGTGLPTAEMQMQVTFMDAGWDFVGERINGSEDIWMMTCEGMSYPKLNWWQPVLGDYFCPDGVDMIDMEHLALHWLDTGCDETNDYCDWAEISNDSTIDFTDFAILAGNWLAGL